MWNVERLKAVILDLLQSARGHKKKKDKIFGREI